MNADDKNQGADDNTDKSSQQNKQRKSKKLSRKSAHVPTLIVSKSKKEQEMAKANKEKKRFDNE